jgi:hypothetical protein
MDRAMVLEHSQLAKRHVRGGAARTARQRELLARLERDGHDTKEGRCLLDNFEETQRMFLADLDRILDEFEKLKQ